MKWIVNNPDGFATSLKEFAGDNLILTNSSAVDVYYDVQMGGATLNSTAAGVIPIGTKIASAGGSVLFETAPRELWVRAATQTTLDVQGNAKSTKQGSVIKVPAGDARGGNNVTPAPQFQLGAHLRSRIFKKALTALIFCLLSFCTARAQLTSQGNETVIIPQSGTATIAINTPAVNFSQTTGTNTFIMGGTPASAARVYITNDTSNNCLGAFQITVATTSEKQVTTFNNALQAWQIVPIINPTTGAYATNTGILPLLGNTTTVITTAAIAGNNTAVIVNNTIGGCSNVNLDVVVVLTPVAITSPLISVASNGGISQATANNVQGIVAAGANGTSVFPVLSGGLGLPVNQGVNAQGVDNINISSVVIPSATTATVATGAAPFPSKPGETAFAFDAHSSSIAGVNQPASPWSCIGGACGGGSPQLSLSVLPNVSPGQSYLRTYSSSSGGPNNDIVIVVDLASSASLVAPTVRQSALGLITFSLSSNTLSGSTLFVAEVCQTSTCTNPGVTDTQGLTYVKVGTVAVSPAGGSPNWTGMTLFVTSNTTSATGDTITCSVGSGTVGACLVAEVINITPANLTYPSIATSEDAVGAQIMRLDAGAPNQFDCNVTLSTNTTTQCQAPPTTINGKPVTLYVTDYQVNTTTAGTATTIQLVTGTGSNCGTGTANLSAIAVPNTAVSLTSFLGMRTPLIAPQGTAVCAKQAGTTPGTSVVEVHGFLAP